MKKGVLKNFAIFSGKLQTCNLIKKRLQHRCLPLNIANFFLKNTYFEVHLLRCATSGGRWGGLPCPILKIEKCARFI